ncbi:exocyst complex component EXO70A1-like [Canna indica]|uniref:Exocyst subunit Exo70 family protein n=1 Tax=Canna indica TaxID=4628 RepID=A0AAQ3QLS6_9LILI|nr:exocyst complex component EXO70A1-like [Canna indica]
MGGRGIENLEAARQALRAGLARSRALDAALAPAAPRLDEIRKRLPSLDASARLIRADGRAVGSAGGHIDRAVGPAAAVLKVFDAVHGLEQQLLADPRADLHGYLAVLRSLEEALRLLSNNYGVAVQWLDDIVDYLDDHFLAEPRFVEELRTDLGPLKSSLPALDGGLLAAALDKIESEFRRLLAEHTILLQMPSDTIGAPAIAPSPISISVISKLRAIVERAAVNNRLDRCISIYVDVRGANVRASLRALDLEYLEITPAEFHGVQSIESYIQKWGQHLEFAVKHIFEAEFKVCIEVFERAGPRDVAVSCFAQIAAQAGIHAFLRFGKTVTETKKDPIKLLKLLDIFATLNKLRVDFNRLFGGNACTEIQNQTRDLIKRVIEGACEIFGEILHQVELQRQMPPPPNGAMPRFVSFVTDYCNKLLSEEYLPVLTQVLIIHQSWKKEKFQERLLTGAILDIFKALEANLETWLKSYGDASLSHIFAMNMHWHFYNNLKGTKLGDLLGEAKLKVHAKLKDTYAEYFLRESWGNLPTLLRREGLALFSGGKTKARDLLKQKLKAFNESFSKLYQKQLNWVISEKELREKICQMIVQTVVPSYDSYMQNYGSLLEQDTNASKYVKYTAQNLENMLGSLFQHRNGRTMSLSMKRSNGKVNDGMANLSRSASTVC